MSPRLGLLSLSNIYYCCYLVIFHDMMIKLQSAQSSLPSLLFWSSSYDGVFIVPVPIYYLNFDYLLSINFVSIFKVTSHPVYGNVGRRAQLPEGLVRGYFF